MRVLTFSVLLSGLMLSTSAVTAQPTPPPTPATATWACWVAKIHGDLSGAQVSLGVSETGQPAGGKARWFPPLPSTANSGFRIGAHPGLVYRLKDGKLDGTTPSSVTIDMRGEMPPNLVVNKFYVVLQVDGQASPVVQEWAEYTKDQRKVVRFSGSLTYMNGDVTFLRSDPAYAALFARLDDPAAKTMRIIVLANTNTVVEQNTFNISGGGATQKDVTDAIAESRTKTQSYRQKCTRIEAGNEWMFKLQD